MSEKYAKFAPGAWLMSPINGTEAMRTGIRNKPTTTNTVGASLLQHADVSLLSTRNYGLVNTSNPTTMHMATSSDMVAAVVIHGQTILNRVCTTEDSSTPSSICFVNSTILYAVFEYKTLSGGTQVNQTEHVCETYGVVMSVTVVESEITERS